MPFSLPVCHNCEINRFNAFRFYPCEILWEENVKKTPLQCTWLGVISKKTSLDTWKGVVL